MSKIGPIMDWANKQPKVIVEEQLKFELEETKSIKEWQSEVHELAKEKGWYQVGKERSTTEFYMLIASEAFEAFEDFRNEKPSKYYEGDKPCGQAIEMADIVLRVMDYCEYRGWSLEDLLKEKHKYNQNREFRHGNKKL